MVLQLSYVGRHGHRLLASQDLNPGNSQTCLDLNATLGAGTCAPFFADNSFFIPSGTVIAPQGLPLPYNAGTGGANGITLVGLRPFSSPQCQPFTGAGCPPDRIAVFSMIFTQHTTPPSSPTPFHPLSSTHF